MELLLPYWPYICLVHALFCHSAENPAVRTQHYLRLLVGLSTTLNILFSDRYHNSDHWAGGKSVQKRRMDEIFWLRLDFIGISFVLSSTFALWSAHFGWESPLDDLSGANALATAAAFCLFERGSASVIGVLIIKATMGVQFVFFFGRMVLMALSTPCSVHTCIWFTYGIGFCAYVTHLPRTGPTWGSHDVFHVFVILGHLVSMACDGLRSSKWARSDECCGECSYNHPYNMVVHNWL
jgi:predicted membrane channel-forming protein YqfA (hemolysin III family)